MGGGNHRLVDDRLEQDGGAIRQVIAAHADEGVQRQGVARRIVGQTV